MYIFSLNFFIGWSVYTLFVEKIIVFLMKLASVNNGFTDEKYLINIKCYFFADKLYKMNLVLLLLDQILLLSQVPEVLCLIHGYVIP